MHKEFRRYVEMPRTILLVFMLYSWCNVETMSLLQGLEQKETFLFP